MKLDTLLTVNEAAVHMGVSYRAALRRLNEIDAMLRKADRPPVLLRWGKRGLRVRAEALELELRSRHDSSGAQVDALESRVDDMDARLSALKNSHAAERRRGEKRWKLQTRINERNQSNAEDILRMGRVE